MIDEMVEMMKLADSVRPRPDAYVSADGFKRLRLLLNAEQWKTEYHDFNRLPDLSAIMVYQDNELPSDRIEFRHPDEGVVLNSFVLPDATYDDSKEGT